MIVLRMILGGILGLIVGMFIFGIAIRMVSRDKALSFAPFGALPGMGTGAPWQLLRSDKKR